jgi:hypothetical protein
LQRKTEIDHTQLPCLSRIRPCKPTVNQMCILHRPSSGSRDYRLAGTVAPTLGACHPLFVISTFWDPSPNPNIVLLSRLRTDPFSCCRNDRRILRLSNPPIVRSSDCPIHCLVGLNMFALFGLHHGGDVDCGRGPASLHLDRHPTDATLTTLASVPTNDHPVCVPAQEPGFTSSSL